MILTVSTVKEPVTVLERFVRGNLAHGIDHMVVCLDEAQSDADQFLRDHPHVTLVRAYDDWWPTGRNDSLNSRQIANAQVVRGVLEVLGCADWLFHIDADEVALVDREALDAVPAEQPNVTLDVLEAVARQSWDGTPTLFKRPLGADELALLEVLGVIGRGSNFSYFSGHLRGKSGVRPDGGAFLSIHHAEDGHGSELPAAPVPGLSVLHFDSPSAEAFVAKWMKMAGAGDARRRRTRNRVASATWTVLEADLAPEVRADYLQQIYARTRLDPEEDLARLGLLEEHHLDRGDHLPGQWPSGVQARFEALLAGVATLDKAVFAPGRWPGQGRAAVIELAESVAVGGA